MFALCQSKFICGFASMLENQRPAFPSIFVIPADAGIQWEPLQSSGTIKYRVPLIRTFNSFCDL